MSIDQGHPPVITATQARSELGLQVTMAVVDEGGLLKGLDRMDRPS
jgi:uncharacterized protein GlcG (DUF336 family)